MAIEGKVVNDHITNFVTGLAMMFAAFFCLNLHYPIEASATLEFIQRLVNRNKFLYIMCSAFDGIVSFVI